jgi:hypothetical protein
MQRKLFIQWKFISLIILSILISFSLPYNLLAGDNDTSKVKFYVQ